MVDLANALVLQNRSVHLVTGRLVVRKEPLYPTVKVNKIVKYNRSGNVLRILTWLLATIHIYFLIKTIYRKDYLLIVTNPPTAPLIPLVCSNRFSLMIFDVYPDALYKTGVIGEKSFITRCWHKANKRVFRRAENIFTLSEGMARGLGNYAGKNNISVVPLWSDNEFFKPIEKTINPFIYEFKFNNKFIVLYSGNLGATHNIEVLPELAERLKNDNILFLIFGDGDRKTWLETEIRDRRLLNLTLLPLQPAERLAYTFSAADVAIVSLSKNASFLSLPSKTFSFMAAGLPLLCIAEDDSELNSLVKKYDNGKCFTHEQIEEISAYIKDLAENKILVDHYSKNSLKASLDFTPKNAMIIAKALTKS